jgi:hypothetical protein
MTSAFAPLLTVDRTSNRPWSARLAVTGPSAEPLPTSRDLLSFSES